MVSGKRILNVIFNQFKFYVDKNIRTIKPIKQKVSKHLPLIKINDKIKSKQLLTFIER